MAELVRRESLPAHQQRPKGVDPSEDGEFVLAGDEITKAEDVKAEESLLDCPECDKSFKTQRGLDSRMEAKH